MGCQNCGMRVAPNPLKFGLLTINQAALVWFLNHMTPDREAVLGMPGFFASWHWFMWWFGAIGAAVGLFLFALATIVWAVDPRGYYKPFSRTR